VPLSKTGAELLFEGLSQRYERGPTMLTSNLPFAERTEILGPERLTGALLDRLTHHVQILEMNGDSLHLTLERVVWVAKLTRLLVAVRGRNGRRAGNLHEGELQKNWVVRGATPTFVETVFAISGVVNSAGFGGAFDRCP
jgi:hypothetical protein